MESIVKQFSKILLAGTAAAILFLSCEKESDDKTAYRHGAFIINEGAYTNNNGSVGFYSYEKEEVYNDIFSLVNDRTLGDVVQSMCIHDGKAYIIVNNSNKVEVVDTPYFQSIAVVEGVLSPRYMIATGNYGYLSCWGDNSVKVIDLETNEVETSIPVSSGPEKMCIVNNKLYVVNTGGWSTDSVVTVIDLTSNEVIKTIEVKYTPSDLVVDSDNAIWVLCYGKVVYSTEEPYPILEESPSKIYRIDTEVDNVTTEIVLFEHEHPAQIEINSEGSLYFGGGYTFSGIYRFNTNDFTFNALISDFAYGLNINPFTDDIYVTISPSYTTSGTFKKYTKEGVLLNEYTCGIGPNSIIF